MEETILKILTPQNFAMLVAFYLLVRNEKILTAVKDKLEDLGDKVSESIERNTRVLSVLVSKNIDNKGNGKCKKALNELLDTNSLKDTTNKEEKNNV